MKPLSIQQLETLNKQSKDGATWPIVLAFRTALPQVIAQLKDFKKLSKMCSNPETCQDGVLLCPNCHYQEKWFEDE